MELYCDDGYVDSLKRFIRELVKYEVELHGVFYKDISDSSGEKNSFVIVSAGGEKSSGLRSEIFFNYTEYIL